MNYFVGGACALLVALVFVWLGYHLFHFSDQGIIAGMVSMYTASNAMHAGKQ